MFLGTAAALRVPSFHCSCDTCEAIRRNPSRQRTRASAALVGREVTVIDPGPDIEFQLERERVRVVNRVFVTHWHYDHVGGLAGLGEPASIGRWSPIELYVPEGDASHFDHELAYFRRLVNLHPLNPGDAIAIPDAKIEVVKTTHTPTSLGYVVRAGRSLAYLVDSVLPPPDTVVRLQGLDLLVLEGTIDELVPAQGEQWMNFSVAQAIEFWRGTGIHECILTHWSGHSWRNRQLVPGFAESERKDLLASHPGLGFAREGMRLPL